MHDRRRVQIFHLGSFRKRGKTGVTGVTAKQGRGAKASRLFSLVFLGIPRVKLHYGIAIAWRPRPYLPRSAGRNCGNSKREAALWLWAY